MIIGFKISSYTDKEGTIRYIQSGILMEKASIERALSIKDFVFYGRSALDTTMDFVSPYCTVVPVEVFQPVYINIAGNKLEVPYDRINGSMLYRELEPSEYFMAENFDGDVQHSIDLLVKNKYLRHISSITEFFYLLQEDGFKILQEDGNQILLE